MLLRVIPVWQRGLRVGGALAVVRRSPHFPPRSRPVPPRSRHLPVRLRRGSVVGHLGLPAVVVEFVADFGQRPWITGERPVDAMGQVGEARLVGIEQAGCVGPVLGCRPHPGR